MDEIIEIIAAVSRKDKGSIHSSTLLSSLGLSESIGLSVLKRALERKLQRPFPTLTWKSSVADLMALPEAKAPAETPSSLNQQCSLGLGVDLQEVSALPETFHFRVHPFYQALFSDSEISTAHLRPHPRLHLCGIFSAKEAVKKAHVGFSELNPNEIEIEHENGKPKVKITRPGFQMPVRVEISISHSANFATATALALPVFT